MSVASLSARALGALVLLLPLALSAQSLPKPKEFYFDADAATAREIVVIPGSGDATMQRLMRTMERNARDADRAAAQLARLAYDGGRSDTGRALYERVLSTTPPSNSALRNALLWNYGWDLYRSGDNAGALARWREAGVDRFTDPAWVPPTLALALWSLDRRDEAVEWYAAAVRTEPSRWADPANLPALLPDWRVEERAVLAEVAAAWRAAPPSWP